MTWDNYKNVTRSYMERIRRDNVQLQLDFPATLKNQNGFYKYMVGKRRLEEFLHHLLNAEGVVVKGMRNRRGT